MKVFRLFSLLDRLRSASGPVSAEELARALEVSPRTIYRDMATLQAMGAPVRGEAGLGYQIERGYFLPPLRLDEEELAAIALGMRLVGARGDGVLREAALRVFGKIGAASGEAGGEVTLRLPLRAVTRERPQRESANRWLPGCAVPSAGSGSCCSITGILPGGKAAGGSVRWALRHSTRSGC